ncbi:hypothetical protein [Streptomyces liliifuscus]|uniref:Uncharacterized protein n=1 Tax=Streptomyces liliifuscus TaxID=2797636 RepID=A0A7T7RFW1_9ACTN|nr:hypothetical protein [Streptomyces liliifuscus]QQM45104.1 hypothetical protein JEQ17_40715 [Streptomyces liliifuscus]
MTDYSASAARFAADTRGHELTVLKDNAELADLLKLHDWDELLFGGFYCTHCTPDDEDSFADPIPWPCLPLREAGITDDDARALIEAHREKVAAEYRAKKADEQAELQRRVDAFNSRYKVGTPVFAYPGCRPEDHPGDKRLITRTRSKAEVLGGHTDVVWVDGHGACIALSHVDVISATDTSPEASAARNVPRNPNELCRDFQSKPEPAEFWCANCRWNKAMHDNEAARTAIRNALDCLPAGGA